MEGEQLSNQQQVHALQVLILKLAHLLPATQGRMDTEAGARMKVCSFLQYSVLR